MGKTSYSNGVMGASGYGLIPIKVETISYGLSIEGASAKGRYHSVFNPNLVTQPGFTLGMVFVSHQEYQGFYNWIVQYGIRATNNVVSTGPMRVIVPGRKFDQVGIPKDGMTFGDEVHAVVYRQQLNFVGARDPLTKTQIVQTTSKYIGPVRSSDAPFFYPGGIQLSGAQSDEGLYGGVSDTDPIFSNPLDKDNDGIPDLIDRDGGKGTTQGPVNNRANSTVR